MSRKRMPGIGKSGTSRTRVRRSRGRRGRDPACDLRRGHDGPAGEGRRALEEKVVGARGFEPPTPCSRSRCATRLRYAPNPSEFKADAAPRDASTGAERGAERGATIGVASHPVQEPAAAGRAQHGHEAAGPRLRVVTSSPCRSRRAGFCRVPRPTGKHQTSAGARAGPASGPAPRARRRSPGWRRKARASCQPRPASTRRCTLVSRARSIESRRVRPAPGCVRELHTSRASSDSTAV